MIDPQANYRNAIAAIASGKGMRNGKLMPRAACLAIRAGVCESEFVADVQGVYSDARVNEIVKAFISAQSYIEQTAANGAYVQRAKPRPKPPSFASHVRNILAGMNADKGAPDWVRDLSPYDVCNLTPTEQTAAFVRAAFRPDELLFVFRGDSGTRGVPGENIRTAADWLDNIGTMRAAGDLVKTNPFSGKLGHNKSGQPSYVSQDCITDYPFVLLEFDDVRYAFGGDTAMGLAWQYAFWRGFILIDKLAPTLVSLTYSGGKSLHGLLYMGANTRKEWDDLRAQLIGLFAADNEITSITGADGNRKDVYPYRIDLQALHPLIGTRLPGVTRLDNGLMQELVYLNPKARHDGG